MKPFAKLREHLRYMKDRSVDCEDAEVLKEYGPNLLEAFDVAVEDLEFTIEHSLDTASVENAKKTLARIKELGALP